MTKRPAVSMAVVIPNWYFFYGNKVKCQASGWPDSNMAVLSRREGSEACHGATSRSMSIGPPWSATEPKQAWPSKR